MNRSEATQLAAVIRRGRLVALLFAGLMVAGMVTATALTHGQNADPNQSPPGALLLAFTGTPLILSGIYALLWWRASRRPLVGLLLGRRRGRAVFLAPPPPINSGGMFLFLVFLTAVQAMRALAAVSVPVTADEFVTDLLLAAATGTYAYWVLFRQCYLVLAQDELLVRLRRRWRIPWDAIAADNPPPPESGGDQMSLKVHADTSANTSANTSAGVYRRLPIRLRGVLTDRDFLTHAIRFYAQHPDARAAIGTATGQDQLLAAFHSATDPVSTLDRPAATPTSCILGGMRVGRRFRCIDRVKGLTPERTAVGWTAAAVRRGTK